ncbi:MAG: ATP-binding cassette domain-containing protein [Bacilli bacterium]
MILELKDISKVFKVSKNEYFNALRNVSLQFDRGEFVSILGPSGCGKSTLLNIIAGLDTPSNGELIIDGKSTKKYKEKDWDFYRKNNIGFIFQSFNLINHLSALENVEMPMMLVGIDSKTRRARALDLLEQVGLKDYVMHSPLELSGGQQQRVSIARALANDPDIILADEPTGALDTQTGIEIMNLIQAIAKDKLVVMVTHNKDLAFEYSNRIVKILDGIIQDDAMIKDRHQVESSSTLQKKNKSLPLLQAFKQTIKNMTSKKGRVALTVFAGSIGIFGISLINTFSTGANNFIDDQVQHFGTANILSYSQNKANEDGVITGVDNTAKIEKYMSENEDITSYRKTISLMSGFSSNKEMVALIGQGVAPKENNDFLNDFITGQQPSQGNEVLINRNAAQLILKANGYDIASDGIEKVIGLEVEYTFTDVAMALAPSQEQLAAMSPEELMALTNSPVDIKPIKFKVSGILNELELPIGFIYYDYEYVKGMLQDTVLPSGTSYYDTNILNSGSYDLIISDTSKTATVQSYLYEQEGIDINDVETMMDMERVFIDSMSLQLKMVFQLVINLVSVVMQAFLVIALVVSAILISIVLFSSILERKVEIGILKAIGARKKDILTIFSAEAFLIGLMAGLLGVVSSYLLIPILNMVVKNVLNNDVSQYLKQSLSFSLILVAISCFIALIAGFSPARRATKMQVVDALREE